MSIGSASVATVASSDRSASLSHTREPLSAVHIGALDGIRGIAVLMVLSMHFGVGARFSGLDSVLSRATAFGWAGVDLFFVLSGFLITGILYDTRNSKFYFRNFYARRALRILPIYYLALVVVFCLMTYWPILKDMSSQGIIWPASFLTYIAIAHGGWLAIPELMSHYWSLSVEEHFYLVWPFIVRWGTRRQLMMVAAAITVFALLLRAALLFSGTDSVAIFVLAPTRADALAVGAFCSLAIRGPAGMNGIMPPSAVVLACATAGLLGVVASQGTVDEYNPVMQTIGFSFIALACGAGILLAVAWQPLGTALSAPLLRWFGRYSYGMYIWHYLIYATFYETPAFKNMLGVSGRLESALYLMAGVGLSILAAVISYHAIEKPFLRLKRYFPSVPAA